MIVEHEKEIVTSHGTVKESHRKQFIADRKAAETRYYANLAEEQAKLPKRWIRAASEIVRCIMTVTVLWQPANARQMEAFALCLQLRSAARRAQSMVKTAADLFRKDKE